MPTLTHILNGGEPVTRQGMSTGELADRYDIQASELQAYAADFPMLFALRDILVGQVLAGMPIGRQER